MNSQLRQISVVVVHLQHERLEQADSVVAVLQAAFVPIGENVRAIKLGVALRPNNTLGTYNSWKREST